MDQIVIFGRQPELGLAELEALYGADTMQPFGEGALTGAAIDFSRLGGSVKLATVLNRGKAGQWQDVVRNSADSLIKESLHDTGKIKLGISAYGVNTSAKQLSQLALSIKKQYRREGRNTRVVPNRKSTLNAAQVLYNKLTGKNGVELIVLSDGKQVIVGRTTAVQDIDAYAKRDREKPVRDPAVGMLPPKLAQIIINLSGRSSGRVLDPFSGTGTLLMEAALMGFEVYGSDISSRMVSASERNVQWLKEAYSLETPSPRLEVADATDHTWQPPIDVVAAETYLGPHLQDAPSPTELAAIIKEADQLHRAMLVNLSEQLSPGTPLSLAVPAWYDGSRQPRRLPMVDDLEKMGYNHIRFEHVNSELIYRRPQQTVGRDILVLIRK